MSLKKIKGIIRYTYIFYFDSIPFLLQSFF
jgi:hypothetical protein